MAERVEKVTALVTRGGEQGLELLLFRHPNAGIQIPAGTVEPGEAPEQAALREAREETGLAAVTLREYLGHADEALPAGQAVTAEATPAYARPDARSFDWVRLRRGIQVAVQRREPGFAQVTYEEWDRLTDPQYLTFRITAWVPEAALAAMRRRHFYWLEATGPAEPRWTVFDEHHTFELFWAPLGALPEIVRPQAGWVDWLRRRLK